MTTDTSPRHLVPSKRGPPRLSKSDADRAEHSGNVRPQRSRADVSGPAEKPERRESFRILRHVADRTRSISSGKVREIGHAGNLRQRRRFAGRQIYSRHARFNGRSRIYIRASAFPKERRSLGHERQARLQASQAFRCRTSFRSRACRPGRGASAGYRPNRRR